MRALLYSAVSLEGILVKIFTNFWKMLLLLPLLCLVFVKIVTAGRLPREHLD